MLGAADIFPSNAFSNLLLSPELRELMDDYDMFVQRWKDKSKTFAFWSSYLEMVNLLLLFVRATRTSNWHLPSVGSTFHDWIVFRL